MAWPPHLRDQALADPSQGRQATAEGEKTEGKGNLPAPSWVTRLVLARQSPSNKKNEHIYEILTQAPKDSKSLSENTTT